MSTIRLMQAKLHRVTVTETQLDYMGSVTIDSTLMNMVGLLPLQEVQIVNVTNGNRILTYPVPGKPDSGIVCINGAAANLFNVGDIVLIFAFETRDRSEVMQYGHSARVVIADADNTCKEYLVQTLTPNGEKIDFTSATPESAPSNWLRQASFDQIDS
jgi:aspartate 1-decarboxylase